MPMSYHQMLAIKQEQELLELRAELDAEKFKRNLKTDQDCPDGEVMVNGKCKPKKVENIPYSEEDLVPQLSEIVHLAWWQKIIRKIIRL